MNKLIVVTNPNCNQCRQLVQQGGCEYEKEIVLIPQVQTDIYLFRMIWSSKDVNGTFKSMLLGEDVSSRVCDVDTKEQEEYNMKRLEELHKVKPLTHTPMFFVDNGTDIVSVDIPQPDIKELIAQAMEE